MAHTSLKKYYSPKQNRKEVTQSTWETMKPFVKFGIKAIGIIGGALISIIKLLPTLAPEKPAIQTQDKRVIKI